MMVLIIYSKHMPTDSLKLSMSVFDTRQLKCVQISAEMRVNICKLNLMTQTKENERKMIRWNFSDILALKHEGKILFFSYCCFVVGAENKKKILHLCLHELLSKLSIQFDR